MFYKKYRSIFSKQLFLNLLSCEIKNNHMKTKLLLFFMLLAKSISAQSCSCPYGSELLDNGTFDEAPFIGKQTEYTPGISYDPGTYMITQYY